MKEQKQLETQVTKLPPYIKQWYAERAKKLGQKVQPFTSMIVIQYALDNGAKEPIAEEQQRKKVQYNDYGEVIKLGF
ncbi:hypothetical protein [Neobacillus niacini]|uniref:hypothetical protein n=1 Tax=Neobacillus niacini TaxID=86668 RepID=UPI0005ED93F2|nr:hypothetical protein [Neobacillus niacini]